MDSDTPVYPEISSRASPEAPEPDDIVQYFCKLTFGQFFTLVVLLVMTLCSSFYLGARYGNQYLRIGETGRMQVAVTATMQPTTVGGAMPEAIQAARNARGTWSGSETPTPGAAEPLIRGASGAEPEDERLKQLAREALSAQQRSKLEGQVQEMLAAKTAPQPTTTAIPPAPETDPPMPYGAEHANTAPPLSGPGPTVGSPESRVPSPESPLVAAREGLPAPVAAPPEEMGGLVKVKSAGGMQYSVQIGAYQDQREAAYFAEEWKIKGYPAYMMMTDLGDRGRWYRVRLGGFPTKEDAERYLTELKTKESIEGIVVYNEQ